MIVYLFPGQGSQKAGMLNALGEKIDEVKEIFDIAEDVTGRCIRELCIKGIDEELKQTINTQLCVTTMNMAYVKLLENRGILPEVVAGHSLGQFSALTASGVITLPDLFRIVQKRAELMEGISGKGKLATIVGLDKLIIENICNEVSASQGTVEIALENSLQQTVIGGKEEDVNMAIEKIREAGAIRIVETKVSNAFHTYMMKPMVEPFKEFVNTIEFCKPKSKLLLNAKGGFSDDPEEIKMDVFNQCINRVKWVDCLDKILKNEESILAEVGFGKVMMSLVRGKDREKKVYCMSNNKDFELFVDFVSKG